MGQKYKIGSRGWLRQHAPVSQFGPVVGSTSWRDLRAKRNRQRQWLRDIPGPRTPIEADEEWDGNNSTALSNSESE
jgi:hypothetical protein